MCSSTTEKYHRCLATAVAVVVLAAMSSLPTSEANDGSDLRIIGGFEALQLATMHQVSLRRKTSDQTSFGSGHFCGGSLINNRTVLTAAHCLVDNNDRQRAASYFRVVGGSLNRIIASANTEIVDVSRVVIHEKYNPKNFDNDVGLLILSTAIPNNHPTLKPINMTTSRPNSLIVCQTSGWGTTRYGVSMATSVLMAVNVTVQPSEICNGTTSYNGSIKSGMLCAGEWQGGRDACQGDSGGPLVCNGRLAGIVSHGNGCGEAAYPGVYADVAYYQEWIRKNGAIRAFSGAISLALTTSIGLMYGFVQRLVHSL